MKIVITTVIDLDIKVWEEAYGKGETQAEIRTSVKEHTEEFLSQDFANRGLSATVRVRR